MKRITIPVSENINKVILKVQQDTGITMSYVQIINFLIHFYMKHANEPKTQWSSLK